MRKYLFILLIILHCHYAFATTYYVRTDGHDSASGLNDTNDPTTGALLTIGACATSHATSPGDICNVHTGSYGSFTVANSGTLGNMITIQAYGDDIVSVTRIKISGPSYSDANYVKVSGFTITGSSTWGTPGIYVLGNNCIISNNNLTGSGVVPGITNYAIELHGDNNIIDSNIIDGQSAGIASFFIVFSVNGTGNIFENNVVKNLFNQERIWDAGGDDSSHMSSDNTIIRGNEAFNNTWNGSESRHPDIFQIVNHTTNTANNWLIENNYFHDLDAQIGINEATIRSQNWIFRNNVFANITQRAMLSSFGTVWYNNTFFNVVSADQNVLDDNGQAGCEYKNNIIIGGSNKTNFGLFNLRADRPIPTISNNYYGTVNGGVRSQVLINSYGDTAYTNGGDPKFVAAHTNCVANFCDFHIQEYSPLIDKGACLSASWPNATDKEGSPRPQGSAWSIGAYEFRNTLRGVYNTKGISGYYNANGLVGTVLN